MVRMGAASQACHGIVRSVETWRGQDWCGMERLRRIGMAGPVRVQQGWQRNGADRICRLEKVGYGKQRLGRAGLRRQGKDEQGKFWMGKDLQEG